MTAPLLVLALLASAPPAHTCEPAHLRLHASSGLRAEPPCSDGGPAERWVLEPGGLFRALVERERGQTWEVTCFNPEERDVVITLDELRAERFERKACPGRSAVRRCQPLDVPVRCQVRGGPAPSDAERRRRRLRGKTRAPTGPPLPLFIVDLEGNAPAQVKDVVIDVVRARADAWPRVEAASEPQLVEKLDQEDEAGEPCRRDPACVARVGKALGARYLMLGSLDHLDDVVFSLQLSLIDSESGKVLAREEARGRDLLELTDRSTPLVRNLLAPLLGHEPGPIAGPTLPRRMLDADALTTSVAVAGAVAGAAACTLLAPAVGMMVLSFFVLGIFPNFFGSLPVALPLCASACSTGGMAGGVALWADDAFDVDPQYGRAVVLALGAGGTVALTVLAATGAASLMHSLQLVFLHGAGSLPAVVPPELIGPVSGGIYLATFTSVALAGTLLATVFAGLLYDTSVVVLGEVRRPAGVEEPPPESPPRRRPKRRRRRPHRY